MVGFSLPEGAITGSTLIRKSQFFMSIPQSYVCMDGGLVQKSTVPTLEGSHIFLRRMDNHSRQYHNLMSAWMVGLSKEVHIYCSTQRCTMSTGVTYLLAQKGQPLTATPHSH